MFKGKKILITGGTGSLGRALTHKLLKTDVETIRIFSREEYKQIQMESELNDERLRFFIGDVRDKDRLIFAIKDVDFVIHTAALKHVPIAEYNPFEAVKTNIYGAQNVIDASLENQVEKVIAIGTDKAVSPFNTYGATKLLMERLFVSANYYRGTNRTQFVCVRYGNVIGSRGSIIPKIIEQIRNNENITITDPSMTRFSITMDEALNLIFKAIQKGKGGEVFIPKLKAYRLDDLKEAILQLAGAKNKVKIISVRPGEKFHESLISIDELRNTYESNDDYIIFDKNIPFIDSSQFPHYKKTKRKEPYSSDKVPLLTIRELKKIIKQEFDYFKN